MEKSTNAPTFAAIPQTSWAGKRPRHWVEICERGPRGATSRVVARTPTLIGSYLDVRDRLNQAMAEADCMASALNKAAAAAKNKEA